VSSPQQVIVYEFHVPEPHARRFHKHPWRATRELIDKLHGLEVRGTALHVPAAAIDGEGWYRGPP
jgi:hypothetical protein